MCVHVELSTVTAHESQLPRLNVDNRSTASKADHIDISRIADSDSETRRQTKKQDIDTIAATPQERATSPAQSEAEISREINVRMERRRSMMEDKAFIRQI
jgi:hypothetical protein